MAHKPLVNGTLYEMDKGKPLVEGTIREIDHGKTLVGGTVYELEFAKMLTINLNTYSLFNQPNADLGKIIIDWQTYTGEGLYNGIIVTEPTTLSVAEGTKVLCYVTAASNGTDSVTGKVYLNGTLVAEANKTTVALYEYTVTSDCTITVGTQTTYMGNGVRYGKIEITET